MRGEREISRSYPFPWSDVGVSHRQDHNQGQSEAWIYQAESEGLSPWAKAPCLYCFCAFWPWVCQEVPVTVHLSLPQYPLGVWQLLSRSRSRRDLTVNIFTLCCFTIADNKVAVGVMQHSRIDSRDDATQCDINNNTVWWAHTDGLVQERRNSSAFTRELRLPCTSPSICW